MVAIGSTVIGTRADAAGHGALPVVVAVKFITPLNPAGGVYVVLA
jgi:hypothetical protein